MPESFQVSSHKILCAVIVINMESRREDTSICRAFHNSHGSAKFCISCIVFCCNSNLRARSTIIPPSVQSGFHLHIIHLVGYLKRNFVIILARCCCLSLRRNKHPSGHNHENGKENGKHLFSCSCKFFHYFSTFHNNEFSAALRGRTYVNGF